MRIGTYLSSSFPIENGLKQEDALSPLLFNFYLECAIREVQETNLGLDMNDIHYRLAYVVDTIYFRKGEGSEEEKDRVGFLLQCLCNTSAILSDAHSYLVV
jgi:hypothetical protein